VKCSKGIERRARTKRRPSDSNMDHMTHKEKGHTSDPRSDHKMSDLQGSHGSLHLRVSAVGDQTALSGITRLVAAARASASRAQALADSQRALLAAEQRTRTWRQNVCQAAIGSENFVARTVQTGPPAPPTRVRTSSPKKSMFPLVLKLIRPFSLTRSSLNFPI
jgi:hypothetical protein